MSSHPVNRKEIVQVEPIKSYRYICVKRINNETFSKKPVYRIFNIKHGSQLGMIAWYNPWRQYIFTTREGVVFNRTCLQDIIEFLEFEIPLLIHREQSTKQENKPCPTK